MHLISTRLKIGSHRLQGQQLAAIERGLPCQSLLLDLLLKEYKRAIIPSRKAKHGTLLPSSTSSSVRFVQSQWEVLYPKIYRSVCQLEKSLFQSFDIRCRCSRSPTLEAPAPLDHLGPRVHRYWRLSTLPKIHC